MATVIKKATKKPSVKAIAVPASYVAGPNPTPCRKGTWGSYMAAVTLRASNPAAATKLHKAKARRAGYNPNKPLDFKWLVLKGCIVAA